MSTDQSRAAFHLKRLTAATSLEELRRNLAPSFRPLPPRPPGASLATPASINRRWKLLPPAARSVLAPEDQMERLSLFQRNIENLIGTVSLPVGIAGPLRVNGSRAKGDYYIPLATTEAALVASYTRGALLISEAGGCSTLLLAEGVGRSPGFIFNSMAEAGQFVAWALGQKDAFAKAAASTTRHGSLSDFRITVEGNHVYLQLEFLTGDAAGQNMATLATQAVCDYIQKESPVTPTHHFVEANLSGDKKASAQSFQSVRGKKVSAEVVIPEPLLKKRLNTDASSLETYWRMSALGGVLSGTIGVQGHYANGLTALFIATGQDAACVSEAAVGVTRFEARRDGSLYAAVTLPNLIVGTVGGGTGLPSQAACLDILGLRGDGKAGALAEVAAGLSLAGELSIIGALTAGEFTRAHAKLARGKSIG